MTTSLNAYTHADRQQQREAAAMFDELWATSCLDGAQSGARTSSTTSAEQTKLMMGNLIVWPGTHRAVAAHLCDQGSERVRCWSHPPARHVKPGWTYERLCGTIES